MSSDLSNIDFCSFNPLCSEGEPLDLGLNNVLLNLGPDLRYKKPHSIQNTFLTDPSVQAGLISSYDAVLGGPAV